jgi:hypothetical protein
MLIDGYFPPSVRSSCPGPAGHVVGLAILVIVPRAERLSLWALRHNVSAAGLAPFTL